MQFHLLIFGVAALAILGTASSLVVPGSTEDIVPQTAMAPKSSEAEPPAAFTADLDTVAGLLDEARRDISLGNDASETLTRLTANRQVAFAQVPLGGLEQLVPEGETPCADGKSLVGVGFGGVFGDLCDPRILYGGETAMPKSFSMSLHGEAIDFNMGCFIMLFCQGSTSMGAVAGFATFDESGYTLDVSGPIAWTSSGEWTPQANQDGSWKAGAIEGNGWAKSTSTNAWVSADGCAKLSTTHSVTLFGDYANASGSTGC